MAHTPIESPLDPAVGALLGRAIVELTALGFQTKLTPSSKHESVVWALDYYWIVRFESAFMEGQIVLHTAAPHYEILAFGTDGLDKRFKLAPGEIWCNQVGMFGEMQQVEDLVAGFLGSLRAAMKT